jgi:hypothetical protein
MGDVIDFPAPAATPSLGRHEVFVAVTEEQYERFTHAKLGLIEHHATEGRRVDGAHVDAAALTIAAPHVHRVLKAASLRVLGVTACLNGPPLDDYDVEELIPVMQGFHFRLRFATAAEAERFTATIGR